MTRGSVRAYALTTGGLAIATVALMGGLGVDVPGAAAGIAAAWVVQVWAFGMLAAALRSGRDATRAWVLGIVIRAGGLLATGAVALTGAVPMGVPASYGITLLAMLLLEAGWLAVGSGRLAAGHE